MFTGFDPTLAKSNIDSFESSAKEAYSTCSKAFYDLKTGLLETWCSPKAVEFSEKYADKIGSVLVTFMSSYNIILANAERAYNTIALANGYSTIAVRPTNYSMTKYEFNLRSEKYGIVGMNIMQVKLLLESFNNDVKKVFEMLDELPMDIAFYDPEGAQVQAYKDEITKLKAKIFDVMTLINTDIKSAIETESNDIRLAKEQATQTLNG